MKDTRIQKALSDAGYTSRRKAEELIAAGKVTVNGRPAETGMKVDVRTDLIAVEGQAVPLAQGDKLWYIALNKPRGFVTTTSDDLGRKCVTELVQDIPARVYPIGRLDRVSEGLLLFTNDGDFANEIMHPRSQVTKTYRVTVRGEVREESLIALAEGVEIDTGKTLPAQITVLDKTPERSVLQFVIREGKNREIRKMCEAVGLEVIRLKRTEIGAVKLGMLPIGKWRELTKEELTGLRAAAKKGEAASHQKEIENAGKRGHSHPSEKPAGKPEHYAGKPAHGGEASARPPEKSGHWAEKSERPSGKPEHYTGKPAHGGEASARPPEKSGHWAEKSEHPAGKPEHHFEKPAHGGEAAARPPEKSGHWAEKSERPAGKPEHYAGKPAHGGEASARPSGRPAGKTGAPGRGAAKPKK